MENGSFGGNSTTENIIERITKANYKGSLKVKSVLMDKVLKFLSGNSWTFYC